MKLKNTARMITLLMALIFLLSVATGCKKDQPEEQDSDVATESTAGSNTSDVTEDTDSLYDENGYLKDTVPELDFDGYNFKMLGWISGYDSDFYAEVDVGDTIVDAVYYRNEAIKERLNVGLSASLIDGNNASQSQFMTAATNAIMAGGISEFDLIGSYSMCGGTLATQGLVCDLNTLDYLDFDKPWWSKSLLEMSTVNNELYFVTGDLSNAYLYNLYCLIVNKNLITTYHLDDPRAMVKNGTWTLDIMIEMTKQAGSDDDDTPGKTEGDHYGYVSYGNVHMDCFLAASGIRMAEENSDGIIQLTEDFTGNRMHSLITKVNDWLHNGDECVLSQEFGYKNIKNGNALFGAVAFSTVKTFQEATWDYALLPYPKVYDTQDSYYTNLGFGYTNFSIPITVNDPDMSAAVLECMNSEAHRTSTPVLYEKVLKSRYSQEALDKEMYDVIRENVYVDANRIFSSSFVWSDSAVALFRNSIINNNSNWLSTISGKKDGINGILATISTSITGS